MRTTSIAAALPFALLCGCGTPMVWQGPAGTGQQELSDTRRECMSRAEAWRTNNELYQQSTIQVEPAVQRREPRDLYRSVDQMFDQCMVAQGYKLVPREQ